MRDERTQRTSAGRLDLPIKWHRCLGCLRKSSITAVIAPFGESSRETVGTICYSSDFFVSFLGLT